MSSKIGLGEVIGGYEILSLLAEGGMGMVYVAVHQKRRERVAFKVLRPEIREHDLDVARFRRESQIFHRLHHPNLIRLLDFGFDETHGYYMVTELLQGQELEEYLTQKGALSEEEALDILVQVCAGLEAAHENKIIHRDVKPGNIFLMKDGGIKVFDFGIGKALDASEEVTRAGDSVGTPTYMAPEQIRGPAEWVGPATDIYALGVIAFQLFTGTVPYSGDNMFLVLLSHVSAEIPLLRDHRPECADSALETLVHEMMQKRPSERPKSMSEVRERLWSIMRQESTVVVSSPFERTVKVPRHTLDTAVVEAAEPFASDLEEDGKKTLRELRPPAMPSWGTRLVALFQWDDAVFQALPQPIKVFLWILVALFIFGCGMLFHFFFFRQ
ncbi:MAG: serine/threonine-protein kinase [Myxococcota bacterium]